MSKFQRQFLRVGYIDELACSDSPVHRIGAEAKLVTTLFFIVTVVSFDRYALSAMLPFFIFPFVMVSLGGLPAGYLLKSILIASPFALMVGIFNPLIDRQVIMHLGGIDISGGWVSFMSIMLRFMLTVSSALILISLTGFNRVCASLERLYVPKPFIIQLMFLYRYLFVLADEAGRMVTARALRSFGNGSGIKAYASLVGHLLLRSMDRAQRIHLSMFSRGFDGNIRLTGGKRLDMKDLLFTAGWCLVFVFFRIYNVPQFVGAVFTGLL